MILLFQLAQTIFFLSLLFGALLGLCRAFFEGLFVCFDWYELSMGLLQVVVCGYPAYRLAISEASRCCGVIG